MLRQIVPRSKTNLGKGGQFRNSIHLIAAADQRQRAKDSSPSPLVKGFPRTTFYFFPPRGTHIWMIRIGCCLVCGVPLFSSETEDEVL